MKDSNIKQTNKSDAAKQDRIANRNEMDDLDMKEMQAAAPSYLRNHCVPCFGVLKR